MVDTIKIVVIVVCITVIAALAVFLLFKKPSDTTEKPSDTTEKPSDTTGKPAECPKVTDNVYVFQEPRIGSSFLSS